MEVVDVLKPIVPVESKKHPSKTMKALQWEGPKKVEVVDKPVPMITDPRDCILRVTTTSICGSDMHVYHDSHAVKYGSILGHEFMGIVEEVGSDCKDISPGDRVVVSAIIACGSCDYCKKELYSYCDNTNPNKEMRDLYGHSTAGVFGYNQMMGGYDGGQAEYVRVPIADFNCLKVPPELNDDQVVLLSDIVPTAWHACEMGEVGPGDVVAVWGLGPVGLLAVMMAKYRGASKVIGIDSVPARLKLAKEKLGAEVIDCSQGDVLEMIKKEAPGGPDVCIDAIGFRSSKSVIHTCEVALHLAKDSPEVLTQAIKSVRKAGRVSIVGVYFDYANQFPIGALMEKGLTVRGGLVNVHKYWKNLLRIIQKGEIDPTVIITKTLPLEEASRAYEMFDNREKGTIKIILKTKHSYHVE